MTPRRCSLLLSFCLALIAADAQSARIVVAGDSTASSYGPERWPRAGWAQVLSDFLSADVQVLNLAVSGRSTRSYRDQGLWDSLVGQLQPGDLVLIQFGHNDAKREDASRYTDADSEFPARLLQFVSEVQAAGARPLLLTPVARRAFDSAGHAIDTHGAYAQAVRDLARQEAITLIDLGELSMRWLNALGPEPSKAYFLHDPATGLADDTHFHHRGAVAMACLVVASLVNDQLLAPTELTRDVDCQLPATQSTSPMQLERPSQVTHAEAIAIVQPGPHGGDGLTVASPFFQDAPGLGIVVRQRVLHVGASIGMHAHGKDEVYYVVSGRAELILDGKAHLLTPGMAVLTRDGSRHSVRQIGESDLVLLILYAAKGLDGQLEKPAVVK